MSIPTPSRDPCRAAWHQRSYDRLGSSSATRAFRKRDAPPQVTIGTAECDPGTQVLGLERFVARFMEVDLVAHFGPVASGAFIHTLVNTDITTGWTECAPLLYS